MKRKKQLTLWRLGGIGLLLVVFFGLIQQKINLIQAISYDDSSNVWCDSDLKITLNDVSSGFLSELGSWETYVLTVPWTVGDNTNENATTCSSKVATVSYSEWNAVKSTYRTALNGSDSGNYFASGVTNAWTRTPSATAGYAYQMAASGGALSTATVATNNSILPGLYLDTTQVCLTDFAGENGSSSNPYSVVVGSNCDFAPTITITNSATAIALNADSSAGLTISGTATDYDGGQTITISATIAGTTKSQTINILATATVNWSLTWSLAELTNGIYTGNKVFTVTDSAGKTGTANYTGTITVDKTAPSVTATSPAYPNNATLTLTDNLGVTHWAVTTNSTAPSTTAAGTNVTNITSTGIGSWQPITQSTSTSATFTPAATGTYYAWVKDVSGNTASVTFTVTNGVFSGVATITGTLYVSESLTSSNTISPVGTYTYQWYRNSTSSTTGATAIAGATSSNYTLTASDASKYVYVVISATKTYYTTQAFTSNILGPINGLPTLVLTPSSGYTRSGSTTTSTISGTNYGTLSCASSNTAAATCSINGTTLTITGGSTSATATITVTEANMSVQATYTVINDVVAPTGMAVSCPGTYSSTGNYVVTQTGTITDSGGSGVNNSTKFFQVKSGALSNGVCDFGAATFLDTGDAGSSSLTQNPMPAGCYVYRYRTSDNSGNTGYSSTCQIMVGEPPTCSIALSGAQGNNSWYTGTLTGTLTTSSPYFGLSYYDIATSYISSSTNTITTKTNTADGTNLYFYGYSQDTVGQISRCTSVAYKKDGTAPTASATTAIYGGTSTLTLADATSGVSYWAVTTTGTAPSTTAVGTNVTSITSTGLNTWQPITNGTSKTTTFTNNGAGTYYAWAKDDAGNVSAAGSFTITQATGYVTLSATSGSVAYGTASSTFTVASSHGGTLSVAETTSTAATVSVAGTTVTIATLSALSAGTTVTVRVTSAATTNYTSAYADYTLTITKVTPTVSLTARSATYNGLAIVANTATVTPTTGGALTYVYYTNNTCATQTTTSDGSGAASSGTAPVNAGSYYVKATVAATTNYNSASSSCTAHTITQATGYVTLSATSGSVAYGTASSTFTVASSHGGTLSVAETTSTAATVSVAGTTVTIATLSALSAGTTVTVRVTSAATTNYTSAYADYTLTITNASFSGGSVTITGTNKVGATLTAAVTNTTPVATYTYQWYSNTSNATTGGTVISGATNSTYVVDTSLVGKYIYVVVTATKTNYNTINFTDITDTSNNGSAIVLLEPTITAQPIAKIVGPYTNVNLFSVATSGTNLSYQWYYATTIDGTGMAINATNDPQLQNFATATLSTKYWYLYNNSTGPNYNGYYFYCVVSNDVGSVTSDRAQLTVVTAPTITTQPIDTTSYVGSSATLTTAAIPGNVAGVSYQWQKSTGSNVPAIGLSGSYGTDGTGTYLTKNAANTDSGQIGLSNVPVTPGKTYTWSIQLYSTTVHTIQKDTNITDLSGWKYRGNDSAHTNVVVTPTATVANEWTTFTITSTVAADALYPVYQHNFRLLDMAEGEKVYYQNSTLISSDGGVIWMDIAGATTADYTLSSLTADLDETIYRARIYNSYTTTATNVVTLNVNSLATAPTCNSATYTGSSQNLLNSGTGYTLSGNYAGTNAGSYTATATLADNYQWTDGTTTAKSITCSIAKATPTLTLSATSGYVGVGKTTTFTETGSVAGNFGNVSGTTSVATVSPASYTGIAASTAKTVTVTGVAAGTSTITVTFTPTDTTNYNTRTATYTATTTSIALTPTSGFAGVGAAKTAIATISGSNYGTATCGTSNSAIATCSISGTTLTMTGVAAGTATITVTGSNGGPTATFALTVDNTNPTCGTWTPATAPWTTSASQSFILASSTDSGGSGIQTAGGSCSVATNGGTCTVTITDNVNNTTVCTSPTAKIDTGLPTVSTTVTPNATWTNSCTASVATIGDTVSGLPASQTVYYAWSTSSSVAPTFSSTLTFSGTAGRTANESRTVANPSAAGTYYLWVKSGVTDVAGNATSSNYVNTATTCQYDPTAPTISLSPTSSATCTTSQSVTVTVADTGGAGLKASQTVKYGWSTSTSVEPASYTDVTLSNSAGAGSTTFTATGTGTSGNYYLWVVPVTLQDQANNSAVTVKSGSFCFDNTAPTISLSTNSDTTYTQTKSVTVTVADSTGLAAGQTLKYGWSTSSSTEPASYTDVTLSNSAGETSTTFSAVGSGLTGAYYLWVVPVTLQDTLGTAQTATTKSTGTFKFDNSVPVCLSPGTVSGTTTSTSIFNLTNSSGADLASYKIYGNSVQNGTPSPSAPVEVVSLGETSKNIFPMNKYYENDFSVVNGTLVSKDQNSITLTATSDDCYVNTYHQSTSPSADQIDRINKFGFPVTAGQAYVASVKRLTNVSADLYVFFYDADYKYISLLSANSSNLTLSRTFTAPANAVYAAIRVDLNVAGNTDTFYDFQVESGSTVTSYQPHNLGIVAQNKNLFDYRRMPTTYTTGGVTVTNNNDGSFAVTCTACNEGKATAVGDATYYITEKIKKLGAGTYSISGTKINNYPMIYVNLYYGGSWYWNPIETRNANEISYEITQEILDNSDFQARIGIYWPSGAVIIENTLYPQLEKASSPTNFVPYQEKSTPLSDIVLRKVGDTADYIDFANQRIVRNVGKYVITGNENWGEHSSIAGLFILGGEVVSNVYPDNNNIISSCSHFQAYSYSNTIGSINFGQSMGGVTHGANRIFLRDTDYSGNLSSFKSWLAAQATAGTPVTVYYQLATPTYEPLSVNIGTVMGDGTLMISDGNMIPSSSEISYYQTGSIPSWSPSAPVPWKVAAATQDFTLTGATDVGGAGMSASSYACTAGATNGATCLTTIADNAGNTNICMSPMNRIDLDNPNCVITGNPSDWTNQNVTLSLASSNDVTSGLAAAPYSWTAYNAGYSTTATTTITNNGTYNAWVKDDAGRWSTCSVDVTKIDKVAPSCSISLAGTVGDNSWYKGAVTGTLSYTDDSGSIRYYDIATSSITTSTNTVSTKANSTNGSSLQFYGFVQDTAGNTATCTSSTYKLDLTKPTVSATSVTYGSQSVLTVQDNLAGVVGWQVTSSATEPTSGWTTITNTGTTATQVTDATTRDAGTYYAWAKDAAGNVSVAGSFSVTKATPIVSLTAKSATYTGSAIVANTATVTPATGGAVTYLYYTNNTCATQTTTADGSGAAATGAAPVNVGSYYVKATVAATTNYNSASSACTAHTITAASFTPVVSMTGYTYGGTKNEPSISGNTSGGEVTYYYNTTNSNSGGTLWSTITSSTSLSAGTYYMYAVVAETANYSAATSATTSFVIAKATPIVSLTARSATYNGLAIVANTATVTPATGGAVTYLYYTDNTCATQTTTADGSGAAAIGAAPVNVGSYYVKATVAATTNYNSASSSCTAHTIVSAATATTGSCASLTYNGAAQTLASGASNAVYSNNTGVNAGSYTVTITANTNYTFSDGTSSKTLSCNIGTKSIAVVWGETTSFIYNGAEQGPTASATSGVTGETLNISRTTATNVGSYTSTATLNSVTGGQALTSNYTLTGNTKAFTITKLAPTLNIEITGTPTTGNTLTANVTTNSDGAKTYQWWTAATAGATSGTAIDGATGNTFVVTNAQAGLYVGVTVTVAETANYASVNGTAITASKAQGTFSGSVSITGAVTYGEALTVNTAGITPTGTYTYQWYSNTTESTTGGVAISGATGGTYVIGSGLVGKYIYVVVTASATDYVSQNFAAVTTATVTKGTPTISLIAKTATYNGLGIAANNATATYKGDSVSLSYNYVYYSGDSCQGEALGSVPVNAGVYSVIATANATSDLNSASSSCTTHTIVSAATATTGSCASLTYNGAAQTLASGASNAVYSNNTGVNAGSYTVTITANTNYTFSDGTSSKTLSCNIGTKSIAVVWGETTSFIYNGAEQGPTASATSGVTGETLNISRTTATNVGSYTSTATLNSVTGGQALTSNYTLTGNTKAFTITPAETTVSLVAKTATYTGSAIAANTATVTPTIDGAFTYVYYTNNTCGTQTTTSDGSGAAATGAAPKNVGAYYVKATFTPTSGNYEGSSSACTAHTITVALTATTGSCASLTYNSMLQTLASGAARATYTNNTAVNAGSYTVTVTANANYAFADGTTSKTLNCSIAKKTATVTAASVSREYNGTPLTSNNCTFAGGIGGQTATCVMTSASTITEVGVADNVIETVTIKDNNEVETTDNYTLTKINGTLTIIDSEIVITDQPNSLSVNEGVSGSFSVTATGSNLTYQWYVNDSNSTTGGTAISGATAATYTIAAENMTGALNGKYYYVILVNSGYTQTSTTALLTVYGIPAPAPTLTASDGIASGNWHKADFTLGISGSTITGAGAVGYLYGTTTTPETEGASISVNTETTGINYYAQAYNTLATTLKSDVSAVYVAKLDKTAPTGAGVTCPAGYSTTGNYTVTGTTGTDTGGSGMATSLSYFQVRTGALIDGVCNYGSNDFGNTGSAGSESLIQNPMPSGCYTYRYIISDNAGNTNTSATCQVLVDINVPSAPSVTITDDEGNELGSIDGGETAGSCNTTGITIYSASASANLNFSGSSDAETGIAGYAYATSAGGTKIEATSLVATATTTGTTYFIYAKDVAGNYSTCYTKVTVKLVTLTVTPNSGVGYVEGENLMATISGSNYGSVSCASSDESKATCAIEGTTLTITPITEGTATITVTETNTNAKAIYTATIWDQPSCTISENPTSWAQSAVLTVSSNNSNLASAPFSWETATTGFSQTTTKNITANDTYTAWVKNDLGLTNSCQITVSNIDAMMPVVLATDDTIYTNQTPITTRIYNVSDVDSGIGSVTWNLWAGSTKLVDGVTGGNTGTTYYKNFDFSSLDEGYYTVTGTVTDVAGNAYDWDDDFGAIGIYYDTTAAVGGDVTIETENINLNTNSIDLTVADGTDNLSGLNLSTRVLTTRTGVLANGECGEYGAWTNQSYSGAYPNLTVTTNYVGDRCYQYRWSVTDMAGNTANYVSEEIKVLAVIVPELTVTPPDANAAAAQDIYVTATVTLGSVSRIAYLWDGELNASCSNGYTIVSGVNLKETQPDGSHVLNVCAISDTNGVATYSDTYGYTAAPIIPTLQYQNTAANLYWNGVALNPLSENLTITGAYAKTGQVYHYRLTLAIQDNGETVTTKVVNVTTSMTNEVLFQFVIPISELNPGKDNSSLMGPQKVTITDLDTDESITFDYNVSFYFPIYQLDYEANAGNYIMIIGAGAANNVPTLQNFGGADCAAWPTVTGDDYSNGYGKKSDGLYLSAYYLRDARDGKLYEVRKLSDGNCWMVDNLAYGGGTDGGSDYCVAKTTMRAASSVEETAATITNGLNAVTGTPTLVGDCRNNPSNGDYGYLYNWAAAIQKTNGYDGLNYAPPQPVTGLCPAGWTLPTGGITGDFPTLANAVTSDEFFLPGGSFKGIYAGMTDTGENIGNLIYQGTRQNYWSSTNSTTSDAYLLHVQSTVVKVQESLAANKQAGRAIRCVKKAN